MNKIDPKIFKAYDIRGVYPDEIDEDTVYAISRGLIEFLTGQGEINNRQFVVGRDFRLSSGDLAEAAIQGLVNSSVDVINIGQCSTPLFYWSIINEQAAGGLMITASHNPGQFNGLKVCSGLARSISSENGLFKIRDFVSKTKNAPLSSAPGKIVEKNLLPAYIDSLKQKIDFKKIKPLKIVIDCANGVMGPEIITLFKNLPCHVEVLYAEPDGNFSNHEPDPIKEENLVALKERILLNKADLGVAFDGDGDRIIFLDEKGKSIRGDFIIVLLAKELLLENPGEKILYGVSSSRVVPESIREAKGEPVLSRTGHSLAKEKMRDQDILFGGELTGHYFFRDLGII